MKQFLVLRKCSMQLFLIKNFRRLTVPHIFLSPVFCKLLSVQFSVDPSSKWDKLLLVVFYKLSWKFVFMFLEFFRFENRNSSAMIYTISPSRGLQLYDMNLWKPQFYLCECFLFTSFLIVDYFFNFISSLIVEYL